MTDTFGDFDEDDAFDTEPADPEQVARKLHALRLSEGEETMDWDHIANARRVLLVLIATRLLEWLRRQGSMP